MKLETTIKPNREGKIVAHFGATAYEFTPPKKGDGLPCCDVKDDEHAKHLLNTGNFHPADEKEFEKAAKLTAEGAGKGAGEGGEK